jgi:hypothetical protein
MVEGGSQHNADTILKNLVHMMPEPGVSIRVRSGLGLKCKSFKLKYLFSFQPLQLTSTACKTLDNNPFTGGFLGDL